MCNIRAGCKLLCLNYNMKEFYNILFTRLHSRSFFQSICVLGYCVFPLAVASVLIKLLSLFGLKKGLVAFIVDFVIVTLAFVWAMFGKSQNTLFLKIGVDSFPTAR